MKRFEVPGYAETDLKNVAPNVWILMYNAMASYPAGDQKQTKSGGNVLRALDAIGHPAEEQSKCKECGTVLAQSSPRLRHEGGRVDLEEADFALLTQAVEIWRTGKDPRTEQPRMSMASYETLELYDGLVDKENVISYKAGSPPEEKPAAREDQAKE